ncbi:hypothetical protein Tco_1258649 [Tanacetum coccineum]
MRSRFRRLQHDQKCKKRKLSQDMQLTQKLRDDHKRMNKAFEDVSGSILQCVRLQAEELKVEHSSRSRSLKTISRNARLHSYDFTLFLLVGNIVTNSRVTPS